MKSYTSYQFKSFLLLLFGISFFLYSDAQRREERHQSNSRGDRGFSTSPGREQRINQQPHTRNPETIRPEKEPRAMNENHVQPRSYPSESIHPVPHVQAPVHNTPVARHSERFGTTDRGFHNGYIHVAPRPQYNYYSNGYRYNSYYRPPVYNARNPGWRYAFLPPRRAVITSFPFAYQTISYGGFGYRYYNGTYYRPYNNAFIVVAPPFGLFINVLPFGYRRIYVREAPYYYYNGTYYDEYENNYRVVAPPVGAVVESIPQGYETIVIDGETYYKVDGVQYKPTVKENGEIWYEVIKVD